MELTSVPNTFINFSAPFDLNGFLANSSTPYCTWSGGNYIVGDSFNPACLAPVDYPIICTVGEGPSQVSIIQY